jgi:hypothetical protein
MVNSSPEKQAFPLRIDRKRKRKPARGRRRLGDPAGRKLEEAGDLLHGRAEAKFSASTNAKN